MRWLAVAAMVFLMGCQDTALRDQFGRDMATHIDRVYQDCVNNAGNAEEKDLCYVAAAAELFICLPNETKALWALGSFKSSNDWLDLHRSAHKLSISTTFLVLSTEILIAKVKHEPYDNAWRAIVKRMDYCEQEKQK